MDYLMRLTEQKRILFSYCFPVLGLFVYIVGTWQKNLAESSSAAWLSGAVVLAALGAIVVFRSDKSEHIFSQERLNKALGVCKANVMVADAEFNICYMNESVEQMMRDNEKKLKEILSGFNVDSLVGTNMDTFHKNPQHQRRMVSELTKTYNTDLTLNGMTFGLVATPLFSDSGERLGTVVEWYDKTEVLAKQKIEQKLASENSRIAQALKICDTNVMMADENFNIIYMNDSVQQMMSEAESEIKKVLPNFTSKELLHKNIDVFHVNPAHQRQMVGNLKDVYKTDIKIGGLTFNLIATPVMDNDKKRIGTVVEWANKTEELKRQARELKISEENQRVKQALDNVTTNAMIADGDGNIVYMNKSVSKMLSVAESDIKKALPQFGAEKVLGSNFDIFHKNPAHQRNLLSKLTQTYSAEIEVGGRTFSLVANPVMNEKDERIGTVVEWADRTHEVKVEREIDNLVSSSLRGDLSVRLDEQGKEGFMLNLSKGLNTLVGVTEGVIDDISRVLAALAHGNLREKVTKEYQGSFDKLKIDANATVDKLIDIIGGIQESALSVSSGADEIAQGNADLSQRTEEQASSLEETASSMEEMTSVVKQSSDNASRANELSSDAWNKASQGGEVVSRAVKAMSEINTASKKIADIIGVIDEIAFQTNLLALNAAVEAARAGEQGRGFAVVAGEVRNLAQRSAGAAKEIKDLIRDSVVKVDDGTKLVNQSGETLKGIVDSVQQVSQMIQDITTAALEQTSGIDQVNTAVAQMDEMTQQNAALVEEASAAGEALSEQARQLMDLIGFFTVDASVSAMTASKSHQAPMKRMASTGARKIVSPVSNPMSSSRDAGEWEEF